MERPSDRFPDAIEPIDGYRLWIFGIWRNQTELQSLSSVIGGPRPEGEHWEDAVGRWISASCRTRSGVPEHRAPVESCTCGFYAMKSLRQLMAEAKDVASMPLFLTFRDRSRPLEIGIVAGRIQMAGKIVEHELGYRAELARIAELFPIEGGEDAVSQLAERLDVPVGPPVPWPSESTGGTPRRRRAVLKSTPAAAEKERGWTPFGYGMLSLLAYHVVRAVIEALTN